MQTIKIDHGRAALLVIDVQQGLFQKLNPIYKADQLLANIRTLADRAHLARVPVFYIQHSGDPAMPEGLPGWQLHPSFQPQAADTLLSKQQDNAFKGTDLHQVLKSKNINTLIVTGLLTHACVKATCQGARQLGYEVFLVEDGHSSYSKDAPRLIEKWNQKLGELGCKLLPAADIEYA